MTEPIKCSSTRADQENLGKDFWEERWRTKDTGWDMATVSPPLKAYIDSMVNKEIRILIPGCGNAYEAEYLMEKGFKDVTVIDISPTLVQMVLKRFEQYAGKELTVICGDFFKHAGKYDVIIEQTFFCALQPDLRKAYTEKMHSLLCKERKLVGLLFNRHFEGGPPFGGSREEYEKLFSEFFEIETMEDCTTSIAPRLGTELFVELKKKNIS